MLHPYMPLHHPMDTPMHNHPLRKILFLLGVLALAGAAALAASGALAAPAAAPAAQASPLHPVFAFLDANETNVLTSNLPVSTMKTCGQCHDTEYIAGHSFHSDLGLSDFTDPVSVENGRAWDQSNGLYGKWNPLTYRYLSADGDTRTDLTPAAWLQTFAPRIVGGGPALGISSDSGVVEMNCFLCHLTSPNNDARIQTIQSGQFGWANTATLLGSGVVDLRGESWLWNNAAFDEDGELKEGFIAIQDPSNENCAQCHGVVHTDKETPLVVTICSLENYQTATTGQTISAQKISVSGVNLSGKDELARSWDIHAERGLGCTDCHYSLNNPAQVQISSEASPAHLQYDPRRLEIGEFLDKPDHNLARGQSAQFTIAPELKATMRRCETCHESVETHNDWLPYTERHMAELACESCHIPQLYAPAIQQIDWTVLQADGSPRQVCRGVEGDSGTLNDLVTGYQPTLLPRTDVDGKVSLAPYNLVTAFYWVYDDANGERPVPVANLQVAWLTDGGYDGELLGLFDANGDGILDSGELLLNTPQKQELIAGRLSAIGLANPRIVGEIQPYSVNHNVARGEFVTRDCQTCHSTASRISQPMVLSSYLPGDTLPEFVEDANVDAAGELYTEGNTLYFRPAIEGMYVFGHNRVGWVDWLGALAFVGVLAGVAAHGGMRFYSALKTPRSTPHTQKVYMYAVYERFWHWMQTFTIVLLLFTGLIIHRPEIFGLNSFPHIVLVHNILAAILVINAALSLFYHLVSGEIKQFIPHPYGFFDQAIVQAKFYLKGIFKGGVHPFEKTPQKKMNPLQQMTYLGILNVLLPLQIITGALMWGVQKWPQVAGLLGGLPFLAPFHSLIAWLFAAFIVAHVYLTTTGHQPLTGIKAMMIGWDEVEAPHEVTLIPEPSPEGSIDTPLQEAEG